MKPTYVLQIGRSAVFSAALFCIHSAEAASFQLLGDISGGRLNSIGRGVSADGLIVVGDVEDDSFTRGAYWTQQTGWVTLPPTDSTYQGTKAYAISDDGSVIVGEGENFSFGRDEAAVWTRQQNGSYTAQLLTPPGNSKFGFFATVDMVAYAVSGDGSVVTGVGLTNDNEEPREAFYWTAQSGVVPMGNLSNGPIPGAQFKPSFSEGNAVSRDGSIIAGMSWPGLRESGSAANEAYRFNVSSGAMVGIGDLQTPVFSSNAEAISKDGLVVVGEARNSENEQVAFRHTEIAGMEDLGRLLDSDGIVARALATNEDGSVVIGRSGTERTLEVVSSSEAFIWTANTGMRLLEDVAGLTTSELGATGYLESANAISDDGLTIVGTYIVPDLVTFRPERQAFRLVLTAEELLGVSVIDDAKESLNLRVESVSANNVEIAFEILINESLNYTLQGTSDLSVDFANLLLISTDGSGAVVRTLIDDNYSGISTGTTDDLRRELVPLDSNMRFWRIVITDGGG
ncbi:MAG: hypothetical protein AAF546_04855 [Verrucomicrobiota bacterium]